VDRASQANENEPLNIKYVVHANLDADSAIETAVILTCGGSDPGTEQALAYDRDALGNIVLIGRIYGAVDDVDFTTEIAPRPEGGLKVRVCVGGCGSDPPLSNYRNREYAWDGSKFAIVK
jgi:hypothetical protein